MATRRARTVVAALAAGVLAAGALGSTVDAQVPPLPGSTTTTAPPSSTTTAAPSNGGGEPSGEDLSRGSQEAPPGAKDPGGDGAPPPAGGIPVPPGAQAIIDSVVRSGASSSKDLLAAMSQLEAAGLSREEAIRVGFGRFPIAGAARYTHDWLYPRYGPGFRFHLGTDVFAAYGTPVRSPVDGVARTATNDLGGLSVKVFMPDGTYFYMAHLSGLVEGFTEGMAVNVGDIVGYVGDSGNARGTSPHVHFSVYPGGTGPVDPKPILDAFLWEAHERLPAVVAAYRPVAPAAPAPPPAPVPKPAAQPPLVLQLLNQLAGDDGVAPELLYVASGNAATGALPLLDAEVDAFAASIDWTARAPQG